MTAGILRNAGGFLRQESRNGRDFWDNYDMIEASRGDSVTELIQKALDDIEENLNRKLDIRDIAKRAYLSPCYFQRLFSAVCGVGAGEHIRCRRLSLAGEEHPGIAPQFRGVFIAR